MEITAIAALDQNRLIADSHGLPWSLPRDVQHFRQYTNGHHMVLGRITFEEMTGWFDRQIPLVLTTRPGYDAAPGHPVQSIEQAIDLAWAAGETELIIGGGGLVFTTALPFLTRMVLTRVHGEYKGTVYFPQWNESEWQLTESRDFPKDPHHTDPFTIQTWIRPTRVTI